MDTKELFGLTAIVGRLSLHILEKKICASIQSNEDRIYGMWINGKQREDFALLPYYQPKVAIHLPKIFVWGGTRLFLFDSEAPGILRYDHDDEIRAVYPILQGWCIVGEIGIDLVDASMTKISPPYSHGEIILDNGWEDGILFIQDLQNRVFKFRITEDGAIQSQQAEQ